MSSDNLCTIAALYLVLVFMPVFANANVVVDKTQPSRQTAKANLPVKNEILPIRQQVLSLKILSEHNPNAAQAKLLALPPLTPAFNNAEQYVLYIVRANVALAAGEKQQALNWLNKAVKSEALLAKKQLNTPLFSSVYIKLAETYQAQGEYKNAFDSRQQYITKYFDYLAQQKQHRVQQLDNKYSIGKKQEENELLTQNSKIKHYALMRAESKKEQQIRHIMIFIAAGFVLILLVIRQYKIQQALNILAKTDPLTQLANRRSLFNTGNSYMKQALSNNSELSVLMLDIDHFKSVNDSFGHDVGDNAICTVARLASETMRYRDVLARIGGEEFAAILPDATLEQARAIAEHMREKIQDQTSSNQRNNLQITVSIGIASIKEVNENFDSLLHAADIAMYQAKANGRNQVCGYSVAQKEKEK
ncbi:MAG: GGDEF domain-containing protein [Cognaticolwellia sp.]